MQGSSVDFRDQQRLEDFRHQRSSKRLRNIVEIKDHLRLHRTSRVRKIDGIFFT